MPVMAQVTFRFRTQAYAGLDWTGYKQAAWSIQVLPLFLLAIKDVVGKPYIPTRSVPTGHRTSPGRVWPRPICGYLACSSSFFLFFFFFFFSGFFSFFFFLFSVLFVFF
jgi:hypothetical protein